jgi:hypothetical protein
LNFGHHVLLHFIEDEGSIGSELHCRDGIQYLLLAVRFYKGDSSWSLTMTFSVVLNNLYLILTTAKYYESSFIRIARIDKCSVLDKQIYYLSLMEIMRARLGEIYRSDYLVCFVICCFAIICNIILCILTDCAIFTYCRRHQKIKTTILEF